MHLQRPVRGPAGFGDLHRLSRAQKGEYGAYGEIFEPAAGPKRENRSGNGAFGRSGNEQTPGCRRAFLGEFSRHFEVLEQQVPDFYVLFFTFDEAGLRSNLTGHVQSSLARTEGWRCRRLGDWAQLKRERG